MIPPSTAPRRDAAQTHPPAHRHDGQRQRHADALEDEGGGRGVIGRATAEVTGQQMARPAQVAQPDRQVETQLMTQRGQRVGLGVGPQDDERRVAGQDLQHDEDNQRGDDQRRRQRCGTTQEEGRHRKRFFLEKKNQKTFIIMVPRKRLSHR
jgi:hypothetical protein